MKRTRGNVRIKQAMRENERAVLQNIRQENKQGEGFRSLLMGLAWHHAIDRLEAKGKIRYRRSRSWLKSGWWVVRAR